MAAITAQQQEKLASRMSKIKNVVLVLSGKGGVGKSSVSCQLALSLLANNPTATVGLLDIDLTGPSLPRMLGLQGKDVHQSSEGWLPVYLDARLRCMSIGFLLKNQKDSVVWRGPKKTAMIRQFLMDVRWGDLDWLIIDTPPGTSDEHISLLEQLKPMIDSATTTTTINAVLVTTPQAVSISDVSKELSFARKTSLPVLGLIENMSGYLCPHCNDVTPIFGQGGGEAFCRIEEEKKANGEGEGCCFLGQIPIDGEFVKLMDTAQDTDQGTLLERYQATPTFSIFKEISSKIVELIYPTSSSQNGTTEQS